MSHRSFRLLALTLLSFVLLVAVAGVSLTYRGRAAMGVSDKAFHQGDLRQAVTKARDAALSYVPGAKHVQDAHARLEAIARGAEGMGDRELARLAWDTLRLVHLQTSYPGRAPSESEARAIAALSRLSRETSSTESP